MKNTQERIAALTAKRTQLIAKQAAHAKNGQTLDEKLAAVEAELATLTATAE